MLTDRSDGEEHINVRSRLHSKPGYRVLWKQGMRTPLQIHTPETNICFINKRVSKQRKFIDLNGIYRLI